MDVSPAMTAVMRERVALGVLDNVTVVEAGFLSYEHRGEPADFVYTRNALHQLPDFWKGIALQRLGATLRPRGILRLRDLVFDFEPADADERITTWLSGAVSDPAVGWTASELAEHVRVDQQKHQSGLIGLVPVGYGWLSAADRRSPSRR